MSDMTAFKRLLYITGRLNDITRTGYGGEIVEARSLPDRYESVIGSFRISKDSYSGAGLTDAEKQVAQQCFAHMKQIERKRGESERDKQLEKISVEIEALRRELQSVAVDAAIELITVVRACRERTHDR